MKSTSWVVGRGVSEHSTGVVTTSHESPVAPVPPLPELPPTLPVPPVASGGLLSPPHPGTSASPIPIPRSPANVIVRRMDMSNLRYKPSEPAATRANPFNELLCPDY